jgi:hypothetical protein
MGRLAFANQTPIYFATIWNESPELQRVLAAMWKDTVDDWYALFESDYEEL